MKDDTILTHAGRSPLTVGSPVNLPVYRASTICSPTLEEYEANEQGNAKYSNVCYGALGTKNAFALCEVVNRLERGAGAVTASSGLAACTLSVLAFVAAGDHVLMPDSVYGPQRKFCETVLPRYGVETSFYDPLLGTEIGALIKANTRIVYTEAPGSLTFEMQDIPAIAEEAHRHSALVIMDNTWAGPLYFKPLTHGVDLCIEAATKYIAGHSDLVLGLVTARTPELYLRLRAFFVQMGEIASPDDCYLALRGLRTLRVRMERQFSHALTIAQWLRTRSEVIDVLYPPLEGAPGHDLWTRDFQGGGALFSIVLPKTDKKALAAMLDGYRLFNIGASWGGYESLVEYCHPLRTTAGRRGTVWSENNATLVRYAIGLEDAEDLILDLERGFERLRKAS